MNTQQTGIVTVSRPLAKDLHLLSLKLPPAAIAAARPGQFAHLRVPNDPGHLLRRPISILSLKDGLLHLAIQPKGEGTQRINTAREGDAIDLLFPLGKGFRGENHKSIWLVGGGVGVAPLQCCAESFPAVQRAFYGFRTAEHQYAVTETQNTQVEVSVCTDDGSAGHHGLVTAPLLAALETETPSVIMACGPTPMLRAVQKIAEERNIPAQLSMEQRMGCGVGACLVCTCKASWDGYMRVCADGPVFDREDVVL